MVSSKSIRNDLQGLRALAVLAVMIFHANEVWLPGGFVGVDVFFVISGYLITGIIIKRKNAGQFNLPAFYVARSKRIIPAYFVMLAIVSVVSAILLTPDDYKFYWDSLKSASYFVSNQYFANFGSYFAPESHELPLLHTWSLAVEMQFYLLLPLLIMIMPEKKLKIVVPAIIIFTPVSALWLLVQGNQAASSYFSVSLRVAEFLIGSWVIITNFGEQWSIRQQNVAGMAGIVIIVAAFFLIEADVNFAGLIALIPCVGAALVLSSRQGAVNKMLAVGALVVIGDLSYSLYLWHWPVLALLRYYTEQYILSTSYLVMFCSLTFLLSWFSWRFIEGPFRRIGRNHFVNIAVSVMFVIAVIIASPVINRVLVPELPVELTRYAVQDDICHGKIVGDCIRGDRTSTKTILVIGDSHAAQLNIFWDIVGKKNNYRVKVITASSCVTIPGFDIERIREWARAPCASQIEVAKKNIEDAKNIVIAGMWEYQSQSEAFMRALDEFLSYADRNNKNIVVMAQIPMMESNILRATRFSSLGIPVNIRLNDKWQEANEMISKLVRQHLSATFFDISDNALFSKVPFSNGEIIYRDDSHLNEVGSEKYGEIAAKIWRL